jgi:hypothetical protein
MEGPATQQATQQGAQQGLLGADGQPLQKGTQADQAQGGGDFGQQQTMAPGAASSLGWRQDGNTAYDRCRVGDQVPGFGTIEAIQDAEHILVRLT